MKKETSVTENSGSLQTVIPKYYSRLLFGRFEKGDKLEWNLNSKGEVVLKKVAK